MEHNEPQKNLPKHKNTTKMDQRLNVSDNFKTSHRKHRRYS